MRSQHGMTQRVLTIAAALLASLGCDPSPAPSVPPPDSVETAPPTPRVEETTQATDGPLRLSIRRVEMPGWSGRVVVASFIPGQHRVQVVPSERPEALDTIVARAAATQPFAAIDGGFYDLQGQPMGLVRTSGRDASPLREGGGSGVLVVEEGLARIVHRDAYAASDAITDAVQSIDRIVSEGRSLVSAQASQRRAARSAVALDAQGSLHLVVAFDERAIAHEETARIALGPECGTTGPTLGEMAELLTRSPEQGGVGAREALGLDGGFSTSMTVKSAARALRIEAYRATINAVLVTARAAPGP
jgi:hypothetical protein